jgi:hypothetical protein
MRGTNGRFSYISQKSKKPVCIIYISPDSDCRAALGGNHFIHPNHTCADNILDELPKVMLDFIMKGSQGSCICKSLNPDNSVNPDHNCSNGPDIFAYNGINSFSCRHNPRFDFKLDNTAEFEKLTKWIKYEIAWEAI